MTGGTPNDRSEAGPHPFPIDDHSTERLSDGLRDSVEGCAAGRPPPQIVSVSDVHGYLDEARSALLTLADHSEYEPVVVADDDGTLHWAGNEYVLVFNGDLVDRGPANVETLRLVARLFDEAPAGRVRVTLGNHEMGTLTPALLGWDWWFSGQVSEDGRRSLTRAIRDGHVVAAYEGYNYIYAHAGQPQPYDVPSVNDDFTSVARQLYEVVGDTADARTQRRLVAEYPLIFGMGDDHPKGPDAGLVWLDFEHLPADAPPQIVGHTRHNRVTQNGAVVCQNVIRNTRATLGGEAVLVESPDGVTVLRRTADGGVRLRSLD